MSLDRPLQKYDVEIRSVIVSFAHKLAPNESLLPPVTATVSDAALTAAVTAVGDTACTVQIGGGVTGQTHHVTVEAYTINADTLVETVTIEVIG
jgi:hypothetical protein